MDSKKNTPDKKELIWYGIVITFLIILFFFVWITNKIIEIINSKP
jgi:uncharacterized membrane protein